MKALTKFATALLLAFSFIGSIAVRQPYNTQFKISSQSKLYIDAISTLHNFKINAKEIKGDLYIQNNDEPAGGLKISQLKVIIPVKKLDAGKGSMNKNMDEALKADKNPDITYSLDNVNTFNLSSDSTKPDVIKTTGKLTIAGVSKKIRMKIKGYRTNDGILHFTGAKKINMVDFGVTPPAMFFGAISVSKDVRVHFDLVLTAQNELAGSK